MNGKAFDDATIGSLFEAARWAPSSYNNQPWRFVYAKRGTPNFDVFLNFLVPANQAWCKNAAILVVILSEKIFTKNGKPSPTHGLDTGSAWENICIEACSRNLVIHGMSGILYEKIIETLKPSSELEVLAMFAAGHPGNVSSLPPELQVREVASSDRRPVSSFAFEGNL